MNLGEFRQLTKDLPDDTDVIGDAGDAEFSEFHTYQTEILPPVGVLGHPHCVILHMGQPVWVELDLDARRGMP